LPIAVNDSYDQLYKHRERQRKTLLVFLGPLQIFTPAERPTEVISGIVSLNSDDEPYLFNPEAKEQ
jgi:hypothetical protein